MTPISASQLPKIISAEFVKLTLSLTAGGTEVHTFSTSYRPETINGDTFTPLGGLMSVGTQQRDLSATGFDTTILLAGVDQTNIFYVLSSDYKIKGSKIEIWRGFYNDNYVLSSTTKRYSGIITSYSIQENIEIMDMKDSYAVSVNCSNFKTTLDNRVAGRNTNPTSWNEFYPLDTSMDRVPSLMNASFNFGQKVPSPRPTQEQIDLSRTINQTGD